MRKTGARAKRLVVVEMGAGKAIASVRGEGEEQLAYSREASDLDSIVSDVTLIRINPRDSEVPCTVSGDSKHLSLPFGAVEALSRISALINEKKAKGKSKLA